MVFLRLAVVCAALTWLSTVSGQVKSIDVDPGSVQVLTAPKGSAWLFIQPRDMAYETLRVLDESDTELSAVVFAAPQSGVVDVAAMEWTPTGINIKKYLLNVVGPRPPPEPEPGPDPPDPGPEPGPGPSPEPPDVPEDRFDDLGRRLVQTANRELDQRGRASAPEVGKSYRKLVDLMYTPGPDGVWTYDEEKNTLKQLLSESVKGKGWKAVGEFLTDDMRDRWPDFTKDDRASYYRVIAIALEAFK